MADYAQRALNMEVTNALSALANDAQTRRAMAESLPPRKRDRHAVALLSARCTALVDAFHVSRSEKPSSAASAIIARQPYDDPPVVSELRDNIAKLVDLLQEFYDLAPFDRDADRVDFLKIMDFARESFGAERDA